MGRIVAYWLLVSLGNFIKITEVAEIFLLFFSTVKVMHKC
jgi:hypothetical protein